MAEWATGDDWDPAQFWYAAVDKKQRNGHEIRVTIPPEDHCVITDLIATKKFPFSNIQQFYRKALADELHILHVMDPSTIPMHFMESMRSEAILNQEAARRERHLATFKACEEMIKGTPREKRVALERARYEALAEDDEEWAEKWTRFLKTNDHD